MGGKSKKSLGRVAVISAPHILLERVKHMLTIAPKRSFESVAPEEGPDLIVTVGLPLKKLIEIIEDTGDTVPVLVTLSPMNKQAESQLNEAVKEGGATVQLLNRPLPYHALLNNTIDNWLQELPSNTLWHIYEGRGSDSPLPNITEVIASHITATTGGTIHEKPYGPKGEVSDGDVTVSSQIFNGMVHDIAVTALTGSARLETRVVLSDEVSIADKINQHIEALLTAKSLKKGLVSLD